MMLAYLVAVAVGDGVDVGVAVLLGSGGVDEGVAVGGASSLWLVSVCAGVSKGTMVKVAGTFASSAGCADGSCAGGSCADVPTTAAMALVGRAGPASQATSVIDAMSNIRGRNEQTEGALLRMSKIIPSDTGQANLPLLPFLWVLESEDP